MLGKLFILWYCSIVVEARGIHYPYDSESREVKLLDGGWHFRLEDIPGIGIQNQWYAQRLAQSGPTITMPAPSSYNDVTVDANIRDHVGVVWYDRTIYVPKCWDGLRVWIRFSSVNYLANVWVNGQHVTTHEFGSLPFLAEVTSILNYGLGNLLTVSVNNTLTDYTIPSGDVEEIETSNGTIIRQSFPFRNFHYAGIDGSVYIYTTPTLYVDDITLTTDIGAKGIVNFIVSCESLHTFKYITFTIRILDGMGTIVAEKVKTVGRCMFSDIIEISDAILWWPLYMSQSPGYMYIFQVTVNTTIDGAKIQDTYRIPFGIRKISFTATNLLINNKPVYLRGVGGSNDADIRGRGFDTVLLHRDLSLLSYLGVNTFRSANFPLHEEVMLAADEGVIIIDECPFSSRYFNSDMLEKHKQYITELIQRDKNRPSVIYNRPSVIPSVICSGSPISAGEDYDNYYSSVIAHIKTLDSIRPVTARLTQYNLYNGNVAQCLDILGINAYYGWYTYPGVLDAIKPALLKELEAWQQKFAKPIFMMEYGADALPGMHIYPEWRWSEEYQISFLSRHFEVFDIVRNKNNSFIGEMIWAFSDFKTQAGIVEQAGGDKKGLVTRQRQPKCAATLVRRRYFHLAHQIDGQPLPQALEPYVAPGV